MGLQPLRRRSPSLVRGSNPLAECLPRPLTFRRSLGQQLALTETLYLTFQMARQFRGIDSLDSRPWTESLGLATTSIHGNEVRLFR